MMLNCDIGERGADHPLDHELMSLIDVANLACGGHAGDASSVKAFLDRAQQHHVQVTAHLSYPDREGFGRQSLNLLFSELEVSLTDQLALLPGVGWVKFHGALYTDSAKDRSLAEALGEWLTNHGIHTLLCPPGSAIAEAFMCREGRVLGEAFLERRYQMNPLGCLELVPRAHPRASISDLKEAEAQARDLLEKNRVVGLDGQPYPLVADTVCIHSDSPIALDLARTVSAWLEESP